MAPRVVKAFGWEMCVGLFLEIFHSTRYCFWILIVTRSFTYTETHLIPLQIACLLISTFALGPFPYV